MGLLAKYGRLRKRLGHAVLGQTRRLPLGLQQVKFLAILDDGVGFAVLLRSTSGRVAAPDSNEAFIKAPRRFSFFDGYVLRDLKLAREMGGM